MATLSEKYSNNATTTLDGGISNSDVTLDVISATAFPTTGMFRIRIDDEIITVGAVSGSTFSSLVRGEEGTSAVLHADTAVISQILTNQGLKNIADRGSVFTDFQDTDFDITDMGPSVFSNTDGKLVFLVQPRQVADTFQLDNASRPFTNITSLLCRPFCPVMEDAQAYLGVGLLDSIGGKIIFFGFSREVGGDISLRVLHFSSLTDSTPTEVAEVSGLFFGDKIVLSILTSSGVLYFQLASEISVDGDFSGGNFTTLYAENDTDFLDNAPDKHIVAGVHFGDLTTSFPVPNLQIFGFYEA